MLNILDLKYETILFSPLRVKPWNGIPSYITNLPKKAFKKELGKLLLYILVKEDKYIEIPMITKKV